MLRLIFVLKLEYCESKVIFGKRWDEMVDWQIG